MGILTREQIRDNGEEFQETTGTNLSGSRRGMDIFSHDGMGITKWDKATQVQAATTDTWTFTLSAATVAVVVITYTDSTKVTIDNVERTT